MKYTISCTQCKGSSRVEINGEHIKYIDTTPIISARYRRDLKWGFECICGNDTRMAKSEFGDAPTLLKGSSGEVMARVIDKMRESTDDSFIMQEIK